MSLRFRLLALVLLAMGPAWRIVEGAAIQGNSSSTVTTTSRSNPQQQQPNRNASAPGTADFKAFMGADQIRQQQMTPPMQPFGINNAQPFSNPPPGIMLLPGMTPPPGVQPIVLMPGMTPPPGVIMMSPPPTQQSPKQSNSTTVIPSLQPNNNTRRDAEKALTQQPTATTTKPTNSTTLKSPPELPLSSSEQQMKQQQPPQLSLGQFGLGQQQFVQPQFGQPQQQFFMPPNNFNQMMPFNPMMISPNLMSQPVMMDAQGRLWFVVQPQFDFNRNPFGVRDTNSQGPQGPPVAMQGPPVPIPIPMGQTPPPGFAPNMADMSKHSPPPFIHMGEQGSTMPLSAPSSKPKA